MLKPEDALEHMLYRLQAGFNFDADTRATEPDLVDNLTIQDCELINKIEEVYIHAKERCGLSSLHLGDFLPGYPKS